MKALVGLAAMVGLVFGGIIAWPALKRDVGPSLTHALRQLQSQSSPTTFGTAHVKTQSRAARTRTIQHQLEAVASGDIPGLVEVDSNHHYLFDVLCTAWPEGAGYFVTDYHCVYGTAAAPGAIGRLLGEGVSLTPLTRNGSVLDSSFNATVVAADPAHDLALLRIGGGINLGAWPNLDRRLPLDLGPVSAGQPLVALDFHAINQRPYAAYGQVIDPSLNDSPDPAANDYPGEPNDYQDVIQVGATVFAGNSGGPVLNAQGQVVGIVALGGDGSATYEATPIAAVGSEIEGWLGQ
ncbi:MAG TPA: serine protease [Candidatus Dormibacteraeota bacterium]|nr:serine protease [Candidatus Dormibacteraeota bacterium]